jgi:glycosyltransferase involved in cell wall biosynthesis
MTLALLITYYGERELLRECLESVLHQTEPPDEVLIYDDASDAPPAPYVPTGMPVRILRGAENRGLSFGRNQLLQASSSTYVHFHDADDLFHPEWCARVRASFESTHADAVFTEAVASAVDSPARQRVIGLADVLAGEDLAEFCIKGVIMPAAGSYRRETVLDIGGFRTSLRQAEDFDFHVRLAVTRPRFAIIADPLVTIRVRPDSLSNLDRVAQWTAYLQAVELLSTELPVSYRSNLSDAAARAGSLLFRLGARDEARRAFKLATRLGPPRFTTQRLAYRVLARTVGFELTEQLARTYRSLLPAELRASIAALPASLGVR